MFLFQPAFEANSAACFSKLQYGGFLAQIVTLTHHKIPTNRLSCLEKERTVERLDLL